MVDRITDEVEDGILDGLEYGTVELGLSSLELDPRLLATNQGEVAYDSRQLIPDDGDRPHSRLHHAVLEFRSDAIEPMSRDCQFLACTGRRVADYPISGQNKLSNQVHEPVEKIDIHTDLGTTLDLASVRVRVGTHFTSSPRYDTPIFRRIGTMTQSVELGDDMGVVLDTL